MNVKIMLWTYEQKKNGTCNLKIYVSNHKGKRYIKTPFHILPSQFDKDLGIVKKNHPNHIRINAKLGEQRKKVLEDLIQTGDPGRVGGTRKTGSFYNYLVDHRNDILNGLTSLRRTTAKNYTSLITRLDQYKKARRIREVLFSDITLEFYKDFQIFLKLECNCGLVGFGKHIKVIKTVMRNAQDAGLHENEIYKNRLFKRHRGQVSNKIYLSSEEVDSLGNLDLSFDPGLDRERDRFLISYFFLMRYEDSRKISKDQFFKNEKKDFIKYRQEKTSRECILPVNKKALGILGKRKYNFLGGSNPQSNRLIKTICALARIDQEVTQGDLTGPKWKFVTTHTARRSAATNLALQNISIKIIADLGGWTDIDTLRNYLRASGLDSALVAKDLDFFA